MKLIHLIGLVALSGAMAAAAACGSDDPISGVGGSGQTGPTAVSSTISAGGMGGGIVDESTSCADAVPLVQRMGTNGPYYDALGYIATEGDSDFFTVDLTADQWVLLATVANAADDPMKIDTVLTLYSADGQTQFAEADDSTPRIDVDSELFHHVLTSGPYCIRIQEFSEWNGDAPEAHPTDQYQVLMAPYDFATYPGANEDSDPTPANDTAATAQVITPQALSNMQDAANIAGLMVPGTDVDWYRVTVPAGGTGLYVDFTPDGIDGYGSTKGLGLVNLYRSDMTTIEAQLDYADGADGLSSVPVTAGQNYFIQVARPDTMVGSNDFYFLKFQTRDAMGVNKQEVNEAGNGAGTNATAETTQVQMNTDGSVSNFVGGLLSPGDIDYWKFPATAGETISVFCSSQRAGSGVLDMRVELMTENATNAVALPMPKFEVETSAADIGWSNSPAGPTFTPSQPAHTVTSTGTYYLRFSATMVSPTVMSRHYLCGARVGQPTA